MVKSSSVMERNNPSETFWAMVIHFLQICFLLLLKESHGQQEVFSFPEKLMALKGSCVEIPCILSYPGHHVMWYVYDEDKHHVIVSSDNTTSILSHYKHRTLLVQPTQLDCTLRIDNVNAEDGKHYYPGVDNVTAYEINRRMVKIDVKDSIWPSLQKPNDIAEGTIAVATCKAIHTCASRPPKFKWNKEFDLIERKTTTQSPMNPELTETSIINMNPKDSDDRTEIKCTVNYPNGQSSLVSSPIRVNYPPKNTTVSILGDPDIQEGDEVTLSCNCRANPEIQTYLWFKGMESAGEGQNITLKNVKWTIEPYSCTARNIQGEGKSAGVVIPVKYAAKGVQIIKYENIDGSIELQCKVFSSNPKITHFTWLRDNIPLITQKNPTLLLNNSEINSGEYNCVAHNLIGNASSDTKVSVAMKAETPNYTDSASEQTSSMYGLIALLPILLILFFILRNHSSLNLYTSILKRETDLKNPLTSRILHLPTIPTLHSPRERVSYTVTSRVLSLLTMPTVHFIYKTMSHMMKSRLESLHKMTPNDSSTCQSWKSMKNKTK
ncbi:B-cell receptor CD22 isoform X2 [Xenopus laevis]|uniref:B-cell receptor CD22 isoform X2 n=1 Tax=Xenopus laevis TaxID=8355 RepID=A0A8J1L7Y0_XENLA|nr:B-cell receptor CD22 isoform X2 [Xenopus laevis]